MKKIALVLAFGLLLQAVPARILASGPPPPPAITGITGGVVAAGIAAFLLLTEGGSASAKATGNEFADLNNSPAFNQLLKQMAGGSLNTLEILK